MTKVARVVHNDGRRMLITTAAATLLTAVIVTGWTTVDSSMRAYAVLLGCIVAWGLVSGIHAWIAYRAFAKLEGEGLEEALGEPHGNPEDGRWFRADLATTSMQLSALALVVVGLLSFLQGVRAQTGLVAAGLVMVATSWINVAVCYAIHYARVDLARGGLDFLGEGRASFVRYLYFAVSVQATFGTTDVNVNHDRMRRIVMSQCILSFVFNSVIVAVIVSMLLG